MSSEETNQPPSTPSFTDVKKHPEVQRKGQIVSDCMLGQYWLTVAGLGVGLGLYVKNKSLRQFLVAGSAGTVGDLIAGYTGPCRLLIKDYNATVKALSEKKENH